MPDPDKAPDPNKALDPAELVRERDDARRQLSATTDVLKIISRSPFDLPAVLQRVTETAAELCQADMASMTRRRGDAFVHVASCSFPPGWIELTSRIGLRPERGSVIGRALQQGAPVQVADVLADPEYAYREAQELGGYRTFLAVPLLREGVPIGVLALCRRAVAPFTLAQIALVESFADQAVIAIENARLFEEVEARTRALSETLEQQTATAEVLKVISRSAFDVQPVFETVAESAVRLCDADKAFVFRFDGELLRAAVAVNASQELNVFIARNPIRPGRHSGAARCALERRTIHIHDVMADPEYVYGAKAVDPIRTVLSVPMLKEDRLLGVILVYHLEVRPFTQEQIALIETFADQAVIAIENVRLFDEVQARTRDLSEALEQQTATSDVLAVISKATFKLQPVFDTIVQTAARLCEAEFALIFLLKDGRYRLVAEKNAAAEFVRHAALNPISPVRGSLVGRTALDRRTVHLEDCLADPEYTFLDYQRAGQYRTNLGVPLLRDGEAIGVIALMRAEVRPFAAKQVALVETFADQALIAIENVRLFEEVQARTEDLAESLQQQTATADVLKLISRSTFDLQTVLHTLVESAARLCDADKATITRQRDGRFYRAESHGFSQAFMDAVRDVPVEPDRGSGSGRALVEGKVVHIPDVRSDPEYTFTEAQRFGEFRSLLSVPMLKEGAPIGVLSLTRSEVRPFGDKEIALVSTFADQAAIAIENVRLFESVEARTRELARSLDELRTAQDRLIQTEKLASLGQLTAGIAHEIKNPLNFVSNFAAVSVELIDELRALLEAPALDASRRAEIGEIAEMLRGNLDKVVQHGKRADSIVKNMLLHSREGSGERRVVDVNAVVEESLNLAYHGARAENRDFNIAIERALDPAAGQADLYPQEITRVLLNLISNGFYAAMKRKGQAADGTYAPVLHAATRNLGAAVEIVIRDNGTGIPPEVKARMFNPFFTTKPPGEGTGLGLSLSHDIVVKQHAGSIDVATEPGAYTEFRIVLPRRAPAMQAAAGGAA